MSRRVLAPTGWGLGTFSPDRWGGVSDVRRVQTSGSAPLVVVA